MPPSPPRNTYAFPVYVDSKEFLTRLVHCASDHIVNSSTTRSFFQPSSYIRVDLLLYDSKPTETRGQYNCMPEKIGRLVVPGIVCLLYTSPSPRDRQKSRMPSSV